MSAETSKIRKRLCKNKINNLISMILHNNKVKGHMRKCVKLSQAENRNRT